MVYIVFQDGSCDICGDPYIDSVWSDERDAQARAGFIGHSRVVSKKIDGEVWP